MVDYSFVFSGFAVTDIDAARTFYRDALGLTVNDESMGHLSLDLPAGGFVLIYPKSDHVAASYTMLNLEVSDIDAAVDELVGRGVVMLRYDGMQHDERGIVRGIAARQGPDIAWFADPSGNIISVLQNAD